MPPTPNTDTHEAWADVSATELGTANGYTANGLAIGGKTVVYNASGVTTFEMDDVTITWTASGGSLVFGHAILHDDTVTVGPPIKPLIGYIDCGAQTITTGNTFTITTGASGLFTGTVTGA